jgi:predicted transcriptional regulator
MEKIAERAGMELNQVTRRMNEIEKEGLVYKQGKGKTKSGRACYLYVISKQSEVQNKISELTPEKLPTKKQEKETKSYPTLFQL